MKTKQKNEITPIEWIRGCILGELKRTGSASLVLTIGTYDSREHLILSLDEINSILKGIGGSLTRTEKDIIFSSTENNNSVLSKNDYIFLCQQYTKKI